MKWPDWAGRRAPPGDSLYRAVVAEARTPGWYTHGMVPDTVDGQFDCVALVLALVLLRLEREGEAQFTADVTERFIADMDGSLRQMGIGDPTVGKQVGHMVGALGGRLGAYRDALAGGDLREALQRNLYRGEVTAAAALDWSTTAAARLNERLAAVPLAAFKDGAPVTPELSRRVRLDELGSAPKAFDVTAKPAELTALAGRFDLLALDRMEGRFEVRAEAGGARLIGRLVATGAQACGLSGEPVPFALDEPVDLRFATAVPAGDEIELSDTDLDTLFVDGDAIDVGEAAAQSLGLALDPYPRAPGAALPPGVLPEDRVVPLKRPNPFDVLKRD